MCSNTLLITVYCYQYKLECQHLWSATYCLGNTALDRRYHHHTELVMSELTLFFRTCLSAAAKATKVCRILKVVHRYVSQNQNK